MISEDLCLRAISVYFIETEMLCLLLEILGGHIFDFSTFLLLFYLWSLKKVVDISGLATKLMLRVFFFSICLPPGLLPVLGPCKRYLTPALDAALIISSRAGTDPGLSSGSIYRYYVDPSKAHPTYFYLATRVTILLVVTRPFV